MVMKFPGGKYQIAGFVFAHGGNEPLSGTNHTRFSGLTI
jgi:hypothetical protein